MLPSVIGASALAVASLAVAGVAWGVAEAHAFVLRRVDCAVLPAGSAPLTVLHLSDLHLTPRQGDKIRWVRRLADERPDLVVLSGDNFGHPDVLGGLASALEPLGAFPGVFVFGSNDYWGPRRLNPFQYFRGPSTVHPDRVPLPTDGLRELLAGFGWSDLNNSRATVELGGLRLDLVGMDDPHIGRDTMPAPAADAAAIKLGVVHAPYRRAVDALVNDGADVVFAGHTHGGQVCLPIYGALVTNCDIDRRAVKGLTRWRSAGRLAWLHVSAGVGASPYAPVRFACRPEATLVRLTAVG